MNRILPTEVMTTGPTHLNTLEPNDFQLLFRDQFGYSTFYMDAVLEVVDRWLKDKVLGYTGVCLDDFHYLISCEDGIETIVFGFTIKTHETKFEDGQLWYLARPTVNDEWALISHSFLCQTLSLIAHEVLEKIIPAECKKEGMEFTKPALPCFGMMRENLNFMINADMIAHQ